MDFFVVRERLTRNRITEIYPEFQVSKSCDIMVRGKSFYAIWNEETELWSTDEFDVVTIIDKALEDYRKANEGRLGNLVHVKWASSWESTTWANYTRWISRMPDNYAPMDRRLTFADTPVHKEDHVSKRLSYSLSPDEPTGWITLMQKLYSPEEMTKIEWAIGSIVHGDSIFIQKFLVLYGDKGTGKSTVLNVIAKLFEGYCETFEAKTLGQANNQFAMEMFKDNPLVAIQHDGDLSRIEDNSKLNSIIAHEEMLMNEKFKPSYSSRINAFLFMGTNRPVKITDAKSGIIRRLIDVHPTGDRWSSHEYDALMTQIRSEYGSIAYRCRELYRKLGKNYYRDYVPLDMMAKTDVFYNFIEYSFTELVSEDPISLRHAWELYKSYVDETRLEYKIPMYKFREALKDYYDEFHDRYRVEGTNLRNVYVGFRKDKFTQGTPEVDPIKPYTIVLDQTDSVLDDMLADCYAQYATESGTPRMAWDKVTTRLRDIETRALHFVRVPENHIVIDFDLHGDDDVKSLELNLEAASKFPPTYAETSRSGLGIHLHYIYDGNPRELASLYDENIEIKVYTGKSSLRRMLQSCNSLSVAHISGGLPLKERKPMIKQEFVTTERSIRKQIEQNLRKEIHDSTRQSINFISAILDEAYNDKSLTYDVSDLAPKVLAFAMGSTHQAQQCMAEYTKMHFKSRDLKESSPDSFDPHNRTSTSKELVFFDLEVYPNLFVVCWKVQGPNASVVKMINPTALDLESVVGLNLIGFNNRKYDNHLLYAAWMGASNKDLYNMSQKLINNVDGSTIATAYGLSYSDVYDFCSKKQSLKKWEIELGLSHMEMSIPWDKPVPDSMVGKVAEYCANDVLATEAVFNARYEDWEARNILSELSGLSLNATTNAHTQQIIFGNDKNPPFVWTDLSETFSGYSYQFGKSTYRGEVVGEGGYVYSEAGYYEDVALLDVASMHPTSLVELGCFGPKYTQRFSDLKEGRIAVKHHDVQKAKTLLNGALVPFMSDDNAKMDALAYSLKIAINSVYGLTAAKFPTRCNGLDPSKNPDNIVAKRGALFMIDLKHFIHEKGFDVAHIKTDSVKIPHATPEIISEVIDFGKRYGYTFEHEDTYDRMCLVNDAVYIARDLKSQWHATGAEFKHPYVFKTLFSHEPITMDDLAETKAVTTSIWIQSEADDHAEKQFIGKVGRFVPVLPGCGGGTLLREKDGAFSNISGTKGYLWKEATNVTSEAEIDRSYHEALVNSAKEHINRFVDYDTLVN